MTNSPALKAAILGGTLFLIGSAAQAQVIIAAPPETVVEDYELAPEGEVVLRDYVVRQAAPSIIIEGGQVRPGSTVPGYVELQSFDGIGDPRLAQLSYFMSPDNKIVLVDPETRRVVKILDRQG